MDEDRKPPFQITGIAYAIGGAAGGITAWGLGLDPRLAAGVAAATAFGLLCWTLALVIVASAFFVWMDDREARKPRGTR
jgi:hypothetical protein